MKILLIHNFYQYWGGEDTYVTSLKKLFEEKGNMVTVYTKNSSEIITIKDKLKVLLGMFINRETERNLTRIIKKDQPEIAQIQNIFPIISPSVYNVLHKFNIPIVQRISNYRIISPQGYHGSKIASLFFSLSLLWHRLIGSFNAVDVFLFPSEIIRDDFIAKLKIPKARTIVIPTFSNELTSKLKAQSRDYFLYVGRLAEEKGILPLLDLFSTLPKIKLVVVGTGYLEKKLDEYRKYRNIIFKGYLPKEKIVLFYKKAIATIVPSLVNDVMPNVVLESFYNSTPVICPFKGIFRKLIRPKYNGLLYKAEDMVDLKKKIIFAYNNKAKMRKMGINSKKEYAAKYSQKVVYKSLINLYKNLLNK